MAEIFEGEDKGHIGRLGRGYGCHSSCNWLSNVEGPDRRGSLRLLIGMKEQAGRIPHMHIFLPLTRNDTRYSRIFFNSLTYTRTILSIHVKKALS